MRPSRLAGLPSFCSSFQLTPVSTPSNRPVLASSTAKLATFSASPRPMDLLVMTDQRASSGTKNSCSSGSVRAVSRGTPRVDTALATSSSKRSDSRFRKRMEKM